MLVQKSLSYTNEHTMQAFRNQNTIGHCQLWSCHVTLYSFSLKRLPWWLSWWRIHLQCRRPGFNPWVGKIPWRRERLPNQYSGLENFTDCIMYKSMGSQTVGHNWAIFTFKDTLTLPVTWIWSSKDRPSLLIFRQSFVFWDDIVNGGRSIGNRGKWTLMGVRQMGLGWMGWGMISPRKKDTGL